MTSPKTAWQEDYAKLAIEISQETGFKLPDNVYRIAKGGEPTEKQKSRFSKFLSR